MGNTAYDLYEETREALRAEYKERFDSLPVNEAGEVSSTELIKLNDWYIRRESVLTKTLIDSIKGDK